MNKEELIALLKSGNFTIVYWDSQEPTIYEGKWDIDDEFEKDDYKEMNKHIVDYFHMDNGYLPSVVELLVEALGGKSQTI